MLRSAALVLCWLCAASGQPELVFHVPDVSVRHEPAPDRAVGTGHSRARQVCTTLCVAGGERPELVFHVPDVSVRHDSAPHCTVGIRQQVDGRTSAARRDHVQPRRSLAQVEHDGESEHHGGSQPRRSVTQVEHRGVSESHGGSQPPRSITQVEHRGASDERHRGSMQERNYEEYFVEHEISAVDAKKAASALRVESIPERAPGCGVCTREEIAYCESHVVADHCCCERRFQEPYSWIPHSCYVGPRQCWPIARDCGFYRRLRDCCCDRRLAEKWKSILSSSIRALPASEMLLVTLLIILSFYP